MLLSCRVSDVSTIWGSAMGGAGSSAMQDAAAHLQGSHNTQAPGLSPGIEGRCRQKPRHLPHRRKPVQMMMTSLQLGRDSLSSDRAKQ